jgi:hypothetical protein
VRQPKRPGLPPLATWAYAGTAADGRTDGHKPGEAVTARKTSQDDLRALMRSLALPEAVAGVSFPTGCRIGRLRVKRAKASGSAHTIAADGRIVSLSRKRLQELGAAARG